MRDGQLGQGRPPASKPSVPRRVLVLQGGGALGSYQAGVYEALAAEGRQPEWVTGISIGAINAALIAGNPPERRVERLRAFWELISSSAGLTLRRPSRASPGSCSTPPAPIWSPRSERPASSSRASAAPLVARPGAPEALSFYDTSPLKQTLERLVDFDLINSKATRLSVGAVTSSRAIPSFSTTPSEDRAGAHHGLGRPAPGSALCDDRRRLLLGRRVGVQYAPAVRARRTHDRPLGDLPDRPVQRRRRDAHQPDRGGRTRARHPLFEPHPDEHRRQHEAAQGEDGVAQTVGSAAANWRRAKTSDFSKRWRARIRSGSCS